MIKTIVMHFSTLKWIFNLFVFLYAGKTLFLSRQYFWDLIQQIKCVMGDWLGAHFSAIFITIHEKKHRYQHKAFASVVTLSFALSV